MQCLLCQSSETLSIPHNSWPGEVFHCRNCDLIFKDPRDFLDWSQQRARYDQHENTIDNPGYREFFAPLIESLRPFFRGQVALDWGAGPGPAPVLAQLLRAEGLQVDIYDPVYHPSMPSRAYDLITSTEVLEHFQDPAGSLRDIGSHLKSGGLFAGMTQFHAGVEGFRNWWYAKDPTHVVFYSIETFQWWADQHDYKIIKLQSPVFLFQKI